MASNKIVAVIEGNLFALHIILSLKGPLYPGKPSQGLDVQLTQNRASRLSIIVIYRIP